MRLRCTLLLAVLPACVLGQVQSDRPVFRGGVELIQINVSVLDSKRQPVRGLTAADFTIMENDVARPIRAFTPVEVPGPQQPQPGSAATAAWTKDIAPDVATNQVGEQPGRLVVIVMDRSIPYQGPTLTARRIATSIVGALGPNDLAALVSTSGGNPQNFTADRQRLITSINQRDWSTESQLFPWGLEESLGDGRCLCGLCVLETVTRIAEAVRETTGRAKVLFFIGQGVIVQAPPRAPADDPGCDRLVRDARIKMLEAIAVSGVTVHSIDPSGLKSIGPQTRTDEAPLQIPSDVAGPILRRQQQQKETNDVLAKQGTLHVLPDMTGGRTVINRNLPEETVPDILRESQSYYLVAFEAGDTGRADGRRSIEVNVRRKDVRVVAQHQYLVPGSPEDVASRSPGTSGADHSTDALSGLLPNSPPPLRLAMAAFANPEDTKAFVSINIDVGPFVAAATSPVPLQLSVMAVDQTGKPVASAQQTSTVPPPSADATAIDLPSHLELPPGDYEVRVAVIDAAKDRTASVFSQVVVPDFATQPLSLSDIAIERVPSVASEPTAPFVSVVPTTERTLRRSTRVQAFVQVSQGTGRNEALLPISVRTQIINVRDRVVDEVTDVAPADAFVHRLVEYRRLIPTQTLTPGEYLLRMVATAGPRTATRMVRFTVE